MSVIFHVFHGPNSPPPSSSVHAKNIQIYFFQAMIKDLRNRYRSTMMHNAHLDNEKQALQYQLENVQVHVYVTDDIAWIIVPLKWYISTKPCCNVMDSTGEPSHIIGFLAMLEIIQIGLEMTQLIIEWCRVQLLLDIGHHGNLSMYVFITWWPCFSPYKIITILPHSSPLKHWSDAQVYQGLIDLSSYISCVV